MKEWEERGWRVDGRSLHREGKERSKRKEGTGGRGGDKEEKEQERRKKAFDVTDEGRFCKVFLLSAKQETTRREENSRDVLARRDKLDEKKRKKSERKHQKRN